MSAEMGQRMDAAEINTMESASPVGAPASRRQFVWKLLLPSSFAGFVALGSASASPATQSRATRGYLREIRKNVHGQVELIQNYIVAKGGTPRPKPTFKNVRLRKLSSFLMVARASANGGVAAAHLAQVSVFDRELITLGSSIASATARHAAFLNSLLGQPLLGTATGAEEYSAEQVLPMKAAFLERFVADLNGGPPPEFERNNPSAENDLLIANTGLLYAMFEAELYDINLPRFFR